MTQLMRWALAPIFVLLLAPAATALSAPPTEPWDWSLAEEREWVRIVVGDDDLMVEIVDDPDLQQRGLSYRDGLAPGAGMLFVYDEPGLRSFWMRGMRFCLDIVWIEAGVIAGAAESVCPEPGVPTSQLTTYPSGVAVSYVLEVPAGWLAERGYGPGTPVDLSELGGEAGD
jgi:uncharacterized protein